MEKDKNKTIEDMLKEYNDAFYKIQQSSKKQTSKKHKRRSINGSLNKDDQEEKTVISMEDGEITTKTLKSVQKQLEVKEKVVNTPNAAKKIKDVGNELRIMALGGLGEIGSNMYIYETKDEILIVDCGASIAKKEEVLMGAKRAVADYRYVLERKNKIKGIVLTHAHDDHISGLISLLQQINTTIYGSKTTLLRLLSLINKTQPQKNTENKSAQFDIAKDINKVFYAGSYYQSIKHGDTLKIGKDFKATAFQVNHSVEGAFGLIIKAKEANIIHTGDFKIEKDPLYEKTLDFNFVEKNIDRKKQTILLSDSTNSIKEGWSISEREVKDSLDDLFKKYKNQNIIISCFSTSSHRVRTIMSLAEKYNKEVLFGGSGIARVMAPVYRKTWMDIREDPENDTFCLICTGSQGEENALLTRIAESALKSEKTDKEPIKKIVNDTIKENAFFNKWYKDAEDFKSLDKKNTVFILASNPIPGNEKKVNALVSSLELHGYTVVQNKDTLTHASGHGYADEIYEMIKHINPDVFIPMHGELIHQMHSEALAEKLKIKRTIILENGEYVSVYPTIVRKCNDKERLLLEECLVSDDNPNMIIKKEREKEIARIVSDGSIYYLYYDQQANSVNIKEIQLLSNGTSAIKYIEKRIEKTQSKYSTVFKKRKGKDKPAVSKRDIPVLQKILTDTLGLDIAKKIYVEDIGFLFNY